MKFLEGLGVAQAPVDYVLVEILYYLRRVNGVNGGYTVFVRCVSMCASVRSGSINQTSLKRLKIRTSNLTCICSKDSPDMTAKIFRKGGLGRGQSHVTP